MKVPIIYMISAAFALFSLGCPKQGGDPVIDYFWPMKEGQVFVYELQEGGQRIVRLTEIVQESSGNIRVGAEEKIVNLNLPLNLPTTKEEFRIVPGKNIIYRINSLDKQFPNEAVYLKGPIRSSTQWMFSWMTPGTEIIVKADGTTEEKETEPEKGTGVCKIEVVRMMPVLGKEIPCAEVKCSISREKSSVINNMFHCKGVGYIGTRVTATMKEIKTNPEWVDRLIEIK